MRRTHLELHEVHCVQILLLHVNSAHAVAHAARLLVLVFAAYDFFVLLGNLHVVSQRVIDKVSSKSDAHAWQLYACRRRLEKESSELWTAEGKICECEWRNNAAAAVRTLCNCIVDGAEI